MPPHSLDENGDWPPGRSWTILSAMSGHVVIDGNNLLHAMHAHAPVANVGRETMIKIIERWAKRHGDDVTLVFDGPKPKGGLLKQMSSRRIDVQFAAPQSADDVIIAMVKRAAHPDIVCVVTDDTAIRYEAKQRRCRHTDNVSFVRELFADPDRSAGPSPTASTEEKPRSQTRADVEHWLDLFNDADDRQVGSDL